VVELPPPILICPDVVGTSLRAGYAIKISANGNRAARVNSRAGGLQMKVGRRYELGIAGKNVGSKRRTSKNEVMAVGMVDGVGDLCSRGVVVEDVIPERHVARSNTSCLSLSTVQGNGEITTDYGVVVYLKVARSIACDDACSAAIDYEVVVNLTSYDPRSMPQVNREAA
jgi:hypothetical protein